MNNETSRQTLETIISSHRFDNVSLKCVGINEGQINGSKQPSENV